MSKLLIIAIVSITLALVFYTVGVFGEKRKGELTILHTVLFWCGFVFDTLGTTIMGQISKTVEKTGINLHGITGAIALILMAFHALWATFIIIKKDEKFKKVFHKFSIVVWAIWLVPYILGMFIGMSGK